MSELAHQDEHYIVSLARLADDRVLKDDDTFAIFDQHGDINLGFDEQGVFHADTRFLSRLSMLIDKTKPTLLGSAVRDDNALLIVDMANPEMTVRGGDDHDEKHSLRMGTLHLQRTIALDHQACYETAKIRNFGERAVRVQITYEFAADFKDIFEVRGEERAERGKEQSPNVEDDSVVLSYRGLDDVLRRCILTWSPTPDELDDSRAVFNLHLGAREEALIQLRIAYELDGKAPPSRSPDEALPLAIKRQNSREFARQLKIVTSNPSFNDWIERSITDVRMMISRAAKDELYIYAGVPWFCTVFGRDGLTVALQSMWCDPEPARHVLEFLAARQAEHVDEQHDAEPGKIVHEMRKGEMAAVGEVPFRQYYGTVDATPLFVMLAGEYLQRTGDVSTAERLWPNVERALAWIDQYSDHNGDGFTDYQRTSQHGLANQGWKDSFDSIMHADGSPAEGPIALCEVQGYVYAARQAAARIAEALGHHERAEQLLNQAQQLKDAFNEQFWCAKIEGYALALDGSKQQCSVRASNAGHCLFTGIIADERAQQAAETLMGSDMFSGWGVRTLSTQSPRYNPTSYHNGSVWPHDNSIIAAGMARYGFTDHALKIMSGMFHASEWFDRHRLPELFCGFARHEMIGPIGYPVACSPQAWASGSVLLMLRAALGLSIDAPNRRVVLTRPTLPESIEHMSIENLRIADASLDLSLHRCGDTVDVSVTRQDGEVSLVVRRSA